MAAGNPDLTGHINLNLAGLMAGLAAARTAIRNGLRNLTQTADGEMRRIPAAATRAANGVLRAFAGLQTVPLAAGLVASLGGLVTALGTAGLAAGAFGLAVGPQVKAMGESADAADKLAKAQETAARKAALAKELEAKGSDLAGKAEKAATTAKLAALDAQKAYDRQTAGLPKATADSALAMAKLKTSYKSWSDSLSGTTMPVFTKALNLMRSLLPGLTPLVKTASSAFGSFIDRLQAGVDHGGFARAIVRINEVAKVSLPAFLTAARNVGTGLAGIFSAFFPAAERASGSLVTMTERFAAFGQGLGQSEGFARFNELAGQGNETLGNLGRAVLNLLVALGPLVGTTTVLINIFAQLVAATPTPVLTALATVLTVAAVATRGYAAVLAIATAGQWLFSTANGASRAQLALLQVQLAALWVQQRAQAAATAIVTAAQWAWNAALTANPIGLVVIAIAALVAAVVLIATKTDWLQRAWSASWGAIKAATAATVGAIKATIAWFGSLPGLFMGWFNSAKSAAIGALTGLVSWLRGLPGQAVSALSGLGSQLASTATAAGARMASALRAKGAEAISYVAGLPGQAASALAGIGSALWNAGSSLITGFISGIKSQIPSVKGVLSGITDSLTSWKGPPAKDARLLTPAGRMLINGFIRGITATTPALRRTLRDVTGDLAGYVRSGLVPGLTGSAAQIKSATTKIQGQIRKAYITDMDRVIDAATKKLRGASRRQAAALRGEIATARGVQRAGGQVLRQVAIQSAVLKRAATARDAVAKQLKSAQDRLKDVQKARSDKAASVRDGILQGADITSGNGTVNSVGAITVGLQLAAKRAQSLTANLANLRKRGLRADLLDDIGSKGLDGAATAEALARATPAELKRINDLQAQLAAAAGKAGNTTAGALYDSGVRAAQGLVDGLKKKQKSIEDQMRRIAESMAKAIKKSLGIRSPSRVFAAIGDETAEGLRQGMLRSRSAVASASAAMASAAVGAADVAGRAMAGVPQPGALTAAYAGAGATSTTNNFYLQGTDASPDGILRALSWRGLVGGR
ncbi:hypothetical protein AB0F42_24480 [Streptomyces buecherae]|uniref:hypothetical protein n=1 Tax=Streptomyces buecherae TaxID=2763006 RepID=UPI0033C57C47